jgi:hypothetical protein
VPPWILQCFQEFLCDGEPVNAADMAALADLSRYTDDVVEQSFEAARAWIRDPGRGRIHALARWLVGTAQRKQEAEQARGHGVVPVSCGPAEPGWSVWGLEAESSPPARAREEATSPAEEVWSHVLEELAHQLPASAFDTWVRDTRVVSAEGGEYVVGVPHAHARSWLENRLATTIRAKLGSLTGRDSNVRFVVEDGRDQG